MTRSVEIPEAAVDAALDVVMDDGHNGIECRPDRNLDVTVRAALSAALPYLALATGAVVTPRDTCPHGDPACPCPDGDMCHYEGPDPMSAPAGDGGLREALAEQAGIWEGYTSDNPDVATGFELAAGKLRYLLAAHPAAPAGDGGLREALEKLQEDYSLTEIVQEVIKEAEWCCEVGCGTGACETCPCCCAGYCVSGRDGVPNDDPEALGAWVEIAAEHNPAIASLKPLLLTAAPAVPQPADERPLRAALEQYFSDGGPDTPIRTTWHEGVEHWEAPAEDIRELIAGSAVPQPVDREALYVALLETWNDMAWDAHDWDVPARIGKMTDAVLAVLAGEQEQVEP